MGRETPYSNHPIPDGITADDVAAYLVANPDFLIQHPDLLSRLTPPPADRDGAVVDLRAFMVDRLRADLDRARRQQRALISASRANLNTQNRIHAAVVFLLDAENFEQLIQIVTTDLAVLLDLDVAALVIEASTKDLPGVLSSGVRVVGEDAITGRLHGQSHLLESDIAGEEVIYGAGAGLVRSQALIRLNVSSQTPPCMLALGSREPDMFHPGMRTELMTFLSRVLERLIRTWLDLPA